MKNLRKFLFGACLFSTSSILPIAQASCGVAFCSLSTQWNTQGVWTEPGTRVDLRYESIEQDQPRTRRDKLSVGEIHRHHDEIRTRNNNLITTLDHNLTANWGGSFEIPLLQRTHSHIHNHMGSRFYDSWDIYGLGDMRAQARYKLMADEQDHSAWGLSFGLKLPTGALDKNNAVGENAERNLQPGSGTTDALLGVDYHRNLVWADHTVTLYGQTRLQLPLNTRQGFRSGKRLAVDLGASTHLGNGWTSLLQLNVQAQGRDQGSEAEPRDSGGHSAWLSPGVAYDFSTRLRLYAFVQLPLYQRVNGVQLSADRSFALGVSRRF